MEIIHKEFRESLKQTLAQIDVMVIEDDKPSEVAYALLKAFPNAKPVVKTTEKTERIAKTNALVTRNNNFIAKVTVLKEYAPVITYGQIIALCEKWDLYLAPTFRFIGDIPEKNAKQIIDFDNSLSSFCKLKKLELEECANSGYGFHNQPIRYNSDAKTDSSFVVATSDLLNMKKSVLIGREVVNFDKSDVKLAPSIFTDPIVLHKIGLIEGVMCYWIKTCWGEEASDFMLQDGKSN